MTDLIAVIGPGKGTWKLVGDIIRLGGFGRVILVSDSMGKQKFLPPTECDWIVCDFSLPAIRLVDVFEAELKKRLRGEEIGLHFISGAGNEHMALMAAVMRLGISFRLVAFVNHRLVDLAFPAA